MYLFNEQIYDFDFDIVFLFLSFIIHIWNYHKKWFFEILKFQKKNVERRMKRIKLINFIIAGSNCNYSTVLY